MYKPKHKRPMELKPNGKVVGLAASAVMLATPILQTAGAVSATTTGETDPNQAEPMNGDTPNSVVQTAEEGTTPAEETTVDLTTLETSITAATAAITEAGDQVAEGGSIVTSADASKVSYLPSATALATALTTAQGLVDSTSDNTDAITTANADLTTQTKNYQAENTARSELQTLVSNTANSLTDSNYSDAKKADITSTLNTARDTLAKAGTSWTATDTETASQVFLNAIQENTAAINTAVNADDTGTTTPETPTVDKAALKEAIGKATALGDAAQYTTTTYNNVQTALKAAQDVFANEAATAEQVETATTNLTNALNDLADAADKSGLQTTLSIVDKFAEANYTPDTWKTLDGAVTQAKRVIANGDATVDDVSTATKALNDAIVGLAKNPETVDKTALTAIVDAANKFNESDYTSETFGPFKAALAAAQATLDKADATDANVTEALNNLNETIKGLQAAQATVDTAGLQALIDKADAITKDNYASDSITKLDTAVANAKKAIEAPTADSVIKALADLSTAMIGLEANPDTTTLSAITALAENLLNTGNYDADSKNALTSAIENAKTVTADPTTATVKTALETLNIAIDGLQVAPETVDKTTLNSVVKLAKGLQGVDYTATSYMPFAKSLTDASAVLTDPDATAKEVNDALTDLNAKIAGLVAAPEKVDTTALTTTMSTASQLKSENYSTDSWTALTKALATAQATLDNPDATSENVAAAVTGLNEAIAGLEAEEVTVDVDTTALKNLITDAKAVNENDYTEASYGKLKAAITAGEAAVATPTVDGVIKAIADLSTAMTGLETKPDTTVDKTVLTAIIAAAEKLKPENYTLQSQTTLGNALANARETRDAEDATDDDVTTSVNALNTAIANLEAATVTVDKTALQSMVNKANDVNGANYTLDSYQALQTATTDAQKVLDNADATTQNVTDALTALNTAYANLVETNVAQAKAALQDVLTLSKNYLSVNYTTDSYGVFKAAVNSGQIVYDDDNVTNVDDVTDATNAIKAAIKGLVPLKYGTTVQNIKDLQAKIADLRVWDYTQDTWEALMEANDNATDILNLGTNATKDQLDDAYNYLNDAFTNLKAVSENNILKQLGDLSTQVQNLNQGQFTDTSWAKLATAQKAAQEILANDNGYNASVASVQNAYDNLQAAVKGLVSVYGDSNQQTDLTDLTNLYKKVQYYTKGSVSDDNWQAFLVARDNAATALKSDDSTVIDYMNAYDALAKAAKTLGSDADMSYIASAAYSEINGVGKVFFEGQGIVLYDKPNGQQVDDADGEGRLLADQTEWKVMRQATLQDGSSWYEVGKNEWVNAKYVMIEEAQVGQIDYLPDMAVNLWNFQPDGLHFTGRRLDNGTAWEMWGSMMINGEQYFNLGANQWVNAQYITVMA